MDCSKQLLEQSIDRYVDVRWVNQLFVQPATWMISPQAIATLVVTPSLPMIRLC
jgi:hypothetical protein